MKEKICKLCEVSNELIKAHILPKWLFNDLKNTQNEKILSINVVPNKNIIGNTQNGFWDTNVLCEKCDNKEIGNLDKYAADFFRIDFQSLIQSVYLPNPSNEYFHFILLNDFDFNKLKLFLVSILFRASISKLSHFDDINLNRYEALARKMLLTQNANNNFFDFIMRYPQVPSSPSATENHYAKKALTIPMRFREEGAICYVMTIAGVEIWIKPTALNCKTFIPQLKCKPNQLLIPVTPFEQSYFSFFSEHIKKHPNYGLSGNLINMPKS